MHSYEKVYEYIIEKIKSGELCEGDIIPKEMDLSGQFGVSRPTVRHALNILVNEGHLARTRGKGSFVTKPKLLQEYTKFIESYNHEMEKKGLTHKTRVLELSLTYPNEAVRLKLSLNSDERIIKLKRLRFVTERGADKPIILTTVYFPVKLMPEALQHDFEHKSFYEALSEAGILIHKVSRIMEIKLLDSDDAALFKIPEGTPCHYITSTGFDESGTAIEYSENIYPADRNKFIIEIVK